MKTRTHTTMVVLCALMWSVPLEGRAQEEVAESELEGAADSIDPEAQETAMARALFLDGVAHARAGSFHRAADYFRRAHAMRPTPAVAYNLASALVQIGRLVEASEALQWVLRHPGTTAEMLAAAEETIAQIRPRLARIRVMVTGGPDEVFLRLDGRPLGLEVLGVMVPVDPGHHVVEAFRGEERVAEAEVELEEGVHRDIELAIPTSSSEQRALPLALGVSLPPREGEDLSWLLWSGIGLAVAVAIAVAIGAGVAAQPGAPMAIAGTTTPPVLEWH